MDRVFYIPSLPFYSPSFSTDMYLPHLFYEPVDMAYFSVSFVFTEL